MMMREADVLVVDDDRGLLRMMRVALEGSGLNLMTAANGVEALEAMSNNHLEVVVLDLEMPVMDGRAFYREMRHRGYTTPVLILSAYDAKRAHRELEANAYIDKPFDPDELIGTLRELISTAG